MQSIIRHNGQQKSAVRSHLSDTQLDITIEGIYGSVRATLMHMLTSEAKTSGKELITIAEERDLSQIFYLDDGSYESPAIIVLIQAINHTVDHRSQIATLLSQTGHRAT